jgi:hypothetical protein
MKSFIREQITLFEKYKVYSCVNMKDDEDNIMIEEDTKEIEKTESDLQIYIDNKKECIECKNTLSLNNFFCKECVKL